ncbi:MAG: hypothetical protein RIR00_1453 [Pseudomonadota bacterium]|jgi:large subunit ribosomal protein L25
MQFELNAQIRTDEGTSASRRLRRAGKVPAIVYGGGQAAQSIVLDHNEIYLALRKEAFHASVLTLNIGGAKQQVLLRDTQYHAYKPLVHHVDFQRVDATHAIHQKVPLHFVNAEIAPGVKLSGGSVSHVFTEIDVACLPQDLPEFIEVDLKDLKVGQAIHISELKLPAGVKAVVHGDDQVVVSVLAKKGGEEAAETTEA